MAGVGKSRLIATIRSEALASGFQVREVSCFEPDAGVPYAPLLELLAAATSDINAAAAEVAGFAANPHGEPDQERHRLFVSLASCFATLSDVQPLLLIVEDIHGCDETTLQFVRYFARHLSTRRIALLLSVRVDEPSPVLQHAAAELERTQLAVDVHVNPLTRADVELMAGAILSPPTSLRPELVDVVFGLAEGNPFFTEESLAVLAETSTSWQHVVLDQGPDGQPIQRPVRDPAVTPA